MCDTCPRVFHVACLATLPGPEEELWSCPECVEEWEDESVAREGGGSASGGDIRQEDDVGNSGGDEENVGENETRIEISREDVKLSRGECEDDGKNDAENEMSMDD